MLKLMIKLMLIIYSDSIIYFKKKEIIIQEEIQKQFMIME